LQLIFKTNDSLIERQLPLVILAGEPLKEAIDSRFMQRRAQGIEHSRQLHFIDQPAVIRIILLKHSPPELLPKSLVRQILRSDVDGRVVLGLPSVRILHFQGHVPGLEILIIHHGRVHFDRVSTQYAVSITLESWSGRDTDRQRRHQ
jgi:hypothetical protein